MELYNWIKENLILIIILGLIIYYIHLQNSVQHFGNTKECSEEQINKQRYDYITNEVGRFVR